MLFCLAVARLTDVQVLQPGRYVSLGERQRVVNETLPAGRGTIFDRNGTELALSVPQQSIYADPTIIKDPVATAQKLAPVLQLDPGTLAQQLHNDGKTHFVYLKRMVGDDVAASVKRLGLAGIDMVPEYKRFYPSTGTGKGVLGATNIDGLGDAGLEKQYNQVLTGTPGKAEYEHSKSGTIASASRKITPAKPGDDLELTLDRNLQYQTEQLLAQQVQTTGSKGGIAIVSDPTTGDILSMANMTLDPDTKQVVPSSNNAALTTVFEPGSVNKVVTVSAALEQHAVTPSTTFNLPGVLRLGDADFTDDGSHPSNLNVSDILTISSNIGAITIARSIGAQQVDAYLRKFGLGTKTSLNFPGESAGIMLPLDQWSGSSIGSIPIGQGVAVTPMQMLEAYNVIANNGVYVAPRLVAGTIDKNGVEHAAAASASHRVVSEQTARQVRGMLVHVVQAGTGTKAAIPGYTVAGKTGTARKPLAVHAPGNGYMDLNGQYHYVSTFVGMVPAENPRLSIIVIMDEPSKGYFAADVSAPLFQKIGTIALRSLGIPPAAPGNDPFGDVPAVNPAIAASSQTETAVGPGASTSTTAPKGTSGSKSSTSTTAPHTSTTTATRARSTTTRTSTGD